MDSSRPDVDRELPSLVLRPYIHDPCVRVHSADHEEAGGSSSVPGAQWIPRSASDQFTRLLGWSPACEGRIQAASVAGIAGGDRALNTALMGLTPLTTRRTSLAPSVPRKTTGLHPLAGMRIGTDVGWLDLATFDGADRREPLLRGNHETDDPDAGERTSSNSKPSWNTGRRPGGRPVLGCAFAQTCQLASAISEGAHTSEPAPATDHSPSACTARTERTPASPSVGAKLIGTAGTRLSICRGRASGGPLGDRRPAPKCCRAVCARGLLALGSRAVRTVYEHTFVCEDHQDPASNLSQWPALARSSGPRPPGTP